jgi:1-acyl-sn-glycerol-3-phosphate acyltransferase
MIAPDRLAVIANIRQKVAEGSFNDKVEISDPTLDEEGVRKALYRVVKQREGIPYGIKHFIARRIADMLTCRLAKDARVEGMENIAGLKGAAIVTSNHFAPFENGMLRIMTSKNGKGHLWAVSQDTNFVMKGWRGFLLRYAGLIPVTRDKGFMTSFFDEMLREQLDKGRYVLIYPEQEMWFNYRKPRPPKRGAYHYAAKFGVPVISCFVEIEDLPSVGADGIGKTRWILHVLKPIFPDPSKTVRENSLAMMEKDYAQKREAYEKAYGKPLDYAFDNWDIAGYEQGLQV